MCALSKKCGVGEYADKPLQATNGTCYACDTTEKVYVSRRGKCEAVCQNRQLSTGGYCALACGEGDYADKPAMKSDGTCVECLKNEHCNAGELCLSKNNSSSSNYEICKLYEVVQYDGFVKLKINGQFPVSWWDTRKACQDLGYSMISGYDLYPTWTTKVENKAVEFTALGTSIRSKFYGGWFWLSQQPYHTALYSKDGKDMANNSYYTVYDTSYTNAFCKTK